MAGLRGRQSDMGTITVFVVLLLPALFLLVGVVVDGGRAMAMRQELAIDAQNAARAGAGTVSVDGLHRGVVSVDQSGAIANAEAYLARCGVHGSVSVSGNLVRVSVSAHVRTAMLAIVGVDQLRVSASATAVNVAGVTQGVP